MKLSSSYLIQKYKAFLENRNYAVSTIKLYVRGVELFFEWLRGIFQRNDIREINREDIIQYNTYLQTSVKEPEGEGYSMSTQDILLRSVKLFFNFCIRNDYILINPFDNLDLSKKGTVRIRESIPESIMHDLLDSILLDSVKNIRDRAMFELMYGTGLRVSEVCNLDLGDVDLNNGRLLVNQGKGRKDRIVPLGENAIAYLRFYLQRSRTRYAAYIKDSDMKDSFFIGRSGKRLTSSGIAMILKKHFKKIKPDMNISPHMIRHSTATHLLERGAGIKQVKEILGHKTIDTTVRYTHFNINSKKRIVRMYHPRENELYKELIHEERQEYLKLFKQDK